MSNLNGGHSGLGLGARPAANRSKYQADMHRARTHRIPRPSALRPPHPSKTTRSKSVGFLSPFIAVRFFIECARLGRLATWKHPHERKVAISLIYRRALAKQRHARLVNL